VYDCSDHLSTCEVLSDPNIAKWDHYHIGAALDRTGVYIGPAPQISTLLVWAYFDYYCVKIFNFYVQFLLIS